MFAESHRPVFLDDVIGHQEIKQELKKYLESKTFVGSVFLVGSPGIGKTTMALCAARTFGFDPLEINASKSIRSFEDVDKLKDACRSCVNIQSFIRGEPKRKTCVILDELDGSDPHAQAKIVEWVKDTSRTVPILCTGNELPTIFKRNVGLIVIHVIIHFNQYCILLKKIHFVLIVVINDYVKKNVHIVLKNHVHLIK